MELQKPCKHTYRGRIFSWGGGKVPPEDVVSLVYGGVCGYGARLSQAGIRAGIPLPERFIGPAPGTRSRAGGGAVRQTVGDCVRSRTSLRYYAPFAVGENPPDRAVVDLFPVTLHLFF